MTKINIDELDFVTKKITISPQEYLTFDDVLLKPKYNSITSRHDVSTQIKLGPFVFATPLIAANMDKICEAKMAIAMATNGGLGVIHRFNTIEEQYNEAKKVRKKYQNVAIALGLKDLEERTKKLSTVANIFVIDIAHGHSQSVIEAVSWLKKTYPEHYVIAGNVATKEAVLALADAGADCVKIGIGPGSMCQTRTVTGCGVPQLSAIIACVNATRHLKKKIPVIADGGIKTSGDIVKAMAAGATMVMLGSLLSGTDETPGEIIENTTGKHKIFRGMASKEASNRTDVTPEGISTTVPYRGSVKDIIYKLMMGLKSGMTYNGAKTIEELQDNPQFIKITPAGTWESKDRTTR